MQRQAMEVSINELRDLADALEEEGKEMEKITGNKKSLTQKWQINIINKKGASDTWQIEKD